MTPRDSTVGHTVLETRQDRGLRNRQEGDREGGLGSRALVRKSCGPSQGCHESRRRPRVRRVHGGVRSSSVSRGPAAAPRAALVPVASLPAHAGNAPLQLCARGSVSINKIPRGSPPGSAKARAGHPTAVPAPAAGQPTTRPATLGSVLAHEGQRAYLSGLSVTVTSDDG